MPKCPSILEHNRKSKSKFPSPSVQSPAPSCPPSWPAQWPSQSWAGPQCSWKQAPSNPLSHIDIDFRLRRFLALLKRNFTDQFKNCPLSQERTNQEPFLCLPFFFLAWQRTERDPKLLPSMASTTHFNNTLVLCTLSKADRVIHKKPSI